MSPVRAAGAKRKATFSADCQTSSGRSSRSSLASILRRLCACLVFWPARFLRMKSSVLSTIACWRSTSGLLALEVFRARHDVVRVSERVDPHPARPELQRARRDGVEEGAVVRDDEHRAAVVLRCPSSHAMVSRSRWLVGSSRSSRSGFCARTTPSRRRPRSPPDKDATGRATGPGRRSPGAGRAW